MNKRIILYTIVAVVLIVAGLFGSILGTEARNALQAEYDRRATVVWNAAWNSAAYATRTRLYRNWANSYEGYFPCVSILGVRELSSAMAMSLVIELDVDAPESCLVQSDMALGMMIPDLLKVARWMGAMTYQGYVCWRFNDWGPGLCQNPFQEVIEYSTEVYDWKD